MNKTTKGALAAGTAAVLLLGGAGSLAFWSADGTVAGTTINSGELKLGAADCGDWKIDGDSIFNVTTGKIVPGDTLTKTCTYAITASGDHLDADVDVTTPATASGALSSSVEVSGAFTVDGESVTKISSANNTKLLSSTVTVKFPYGVKNNDSQALAGVLSDYVVTATQKHA